MSYLMLLPKSCVVTIIDERKWPSGREELSTSWIITVGVDSIAPTDKCMFQHIIIQWILKLFPLKTANKRKLVKKNLHVSDQLRTLWPFSTLKLDWRHFSPILHTHIRFSVRTVPADFGCSRQISDDPD